MNERLLVMQTQGKYFVG